MRSQWPPAGWGGAVQPTGLRVGVPRAPRPDSTRTEGAPAARAHRRWPQFPAGTLGAAAGICGRSARPGHRPPGSSCWCLGRGGGAGCAAASGAACRATRALDAGDLARPGGSGRGRPRAASEAGGEPDRQRGAAARGSEDAGRPAPARALEAAGGHLSRLRPYHPERARSRLISEAKQGRAWLVLGWETAWEYRVL